MPNYHRFRSQWYPSSWVLSPITTFFSLPSSWVISPTTTGFSLTSSWVLSPTAHTPVCWHIPPPQEWRPERHKAERGQHPTRCWYIQYPGTSFPGRCQRHHRHHSHQGPRRLPHHPDYSLRFYCSGVSMRTGHCCCCRCSWRVWMPGRHCCLFCHVSDQYRSAASPHWSARLVSLSGESMRPRIRFLLV